jgi:hypothetical protein
MQTLVWAKGRSLPLGRPGSRLREPRRPDPDSKRTFDTTHSYGNDGNLAAVGDFDFFWSMSPKAHGNCSARVHRFG